MYGGVPVMFPLLSEALQKVGTYIVHHLGVAPFSSLSNPKQFVHEKLMKLKSSQPRAFIVLHASLPMTTVLFTEAKKMDFGGKDSIWVLWKSRQYSENSKQYQEFYEQFRQRFQLEYAEEENYKPGIHALRASDSITAIIAALDRDNKTFTSERLLDSLLSSSFTGLSGEIHFEDGRLSYQSIYRVINVFNMTYNKLGYWSPDFGFSKSLDVAEYGKNDSSGKGNTFSKLVDGFIKPPGDLKRVPEGWTMPSLENPLIIGVPGNATSENLVKITSIKNSAEKIYSGFCIRVFEEVKRILEYDLPSRYVEFNGTYDNLVGNVANKLATGAVLIYTMFVVWFLEHRSNPEFGGPWKDQLGNVLWFTFSSLFPAHTFLDVPYAKVFVNKYCRKYRVYGSSYRFGGFGFVFQKGSPIAADISKAILQLMEDGTLKRLEEERLTPSAKCRNSQTDKNIDVLSFQSFWGLYLFSIATSSICFLLFLAKLLKSFYHDHESGDINGSDDNVWNKTVRLARYLYKAETGNQRRAPTSSWESPYPTSET
ncbi:hypothetical protein RHMOL_Rhmol13G0245300 [Rhododendron molle]|uniref:Uncharacterized protein n=1 Tax=Rhododendron molle TaxID=49168 RepID=A0ACC0LA89_RHOML|nr:hypothetical protein RHMOL_Rhmol13G0245300 [Rhododendron molle]